MLKVPLFLQAVFPTFIYTNVNQTTRKPKGVRVIRKTTLKLKIKHSIIKLTLNVAILIFLTNKYDK